MIPSTTPATSRLNVSWPASANRSMWISGAGALIGLLLTGDALFTAKGTITPGVPPEDLALVNQRPVLMSDFEAQTQAEFGVSLDQASPEQKRKVVEEMLREELFVQRALELDEASTDPDTRAAMVAAVEQQTAAEASSRAPSEDELRAYYARTRDRYAAVGRMTVRDFVPGPGPADQRLALTRRAAQALEVGPKTVEAARRLGLVESGRMVDGEEFDFAAEIHLGQSLFNLARSLADGQVAGPAMGPDGPHVLVMVHNVRPIPRTFEAARAEVLTNYKSDLEARLQAEEYRYLRDKADIRIAEAYK